MKAKYLFLAVAVLLVVGGLWYVRTTVSGTLETPESTSGVDSKTPDVRPAPGHTLRPPDPTRRFRELSPEERVRLARQGPIGG